MASAGGGVGTIVRPDHLTVSPRDPLIVSSLHRSHRSGRVGSSLQSRAPFAKEGVAGSNPFFRSNNTLRGGKIGTKPAV